MSALDDYLERMRQEGPEWKPAVSLNAAGALMARSYLYPVSAPAVATATHEELHPEHHDDHEVHLIMAEAINQIMSGNKLMYVRPSELNEFIQHIVTEVEAFRAERRMNPQVSAARLRHKIGAGSHFAFNMTRHADQHHPDHPDTLEHSHKTGGAHTPKTCIHGPSHHGHVCDALGMFHHHSDAFN